MAQANYPDRAEHVMKLVRDMRGGKDYDSKWGERMKGTGPYAWTIGRRFEIACERLGLNKHKVPPQQPSSSTRPSRAPSSSACSDDDAVAQTHGGDSRRARRARQRAVL
jgi:hypothetical protein